MTDLSRRSFLRGALVLSAATVLPAVALAAPVPVLVGDGVHDDTDALNALFSGRPFRCESDVVALHRNGNALLEGGKYFITDTVTIGEEIPADVYGVNFYVKDEMWDGKNYCIYLGNLARAGNWSVQPATPRKEWTLVTTGGLYTGRSSDTLAVAIA